MTAITIGRNSKGDDEVHRAGCAHLQQRRRIQRVITTYRGATLLDAIVSADEDMADAFGEEAYSDPETQDSQPWSIEVMIHAPCFTEMMKQESITFSGPWGRPETGRSN